MQWTGDPAASGPAALSGPVAGAARALYLTIARGPTSRLELTMDWDYPVFEREVRDESGGTLSVRQKEALPAAEAYAYVAGEDQRPLLVLRECLSCTGTDDALLTRQADNERTMLLSRWFHCVKLPPNVLDEDHPFKKLFPGEESAHLFVARSDGNGRLDLDGAQSRTELWGVMGALLKTEYSQKADRPLKQLLRILDQYDALDERITQLEISLDDQIEKNGPGSSKVKKIKKELARFHEDRAGLRAKANKISNLKLRKAKTVQAAPSDDESA